MARYGGNIPSGQCSCVDCRWERAIPRRGFDPQAREQYERHNEPELTFENWKESVDQQIRETAGYNLDHASTIVTNMPIVLKTQFEAKRSAEEVSQKIITVVEAYQ